MAEAPCEPHRVDAIAWGSGQTPGDSRGLARGRELSQGSCYWVGPNVQAAPGGFPMGSMRPGLAPFWRSWRFSGALAFWNRLKEILKVGSTRRARRGSQACPEPHSAHTP